MAHAFALDRFPPSRLPLLASRLTRMMGRACRPLGLTAPGWRIMALLSQKDAIPLREVAARSAIGKARLSRVTRALCAQGYIEQRNVSRDRRRVSLHLTPRGKDVCRDLVAVMLDLQTKLVFVEKPDAVFPAGKLDGHHHIGNQKRMFKKHAANSVVVLASTIDVHDKTKLLPEQYASFLA